MPDVPGSNLTSVEFLSHLPHPEKLRIIFMIDNNFSATDIDFFPRFVNRKLSSNSSLICPRDFNIYAGY